LPVADLIFEKKKWHIPHKAPYQRDEVTKFSNLS
jgi:hypothetical protein